MPPPPEPAERPIRVLLVDDQAIVGESIRRMVAAEPDIELTFCPHPARAIETARRVRPTVILQDLVMPEVDGLLLVKFFRAEPATRDVPMVVLSSKEEPVIKARAFALGANDYLVKLPDKLELLARVRYHSQAYRALTERNEAFARLAESERQLAGEVAQAERYVRSLLPPPLAGEVTVRWKFVPSTQLGGDMFGYHWLDADHLAVYLLDVSGHGVGSSLLAVSAANVLGGQGAAGIDPHDPAGVVAKLSDLFQMERQDGKYFTVFYGVFHRPSRVLRYCNAAHPAALLFDPAAGPGAAPRELSSDNPVVGMLPPGFPFEGAEVPVPPGARLLIFSDGVFEIERADGSFWPFAEFVEFMAGHSGDADAGGAAYAEARRLKGGPALADDFSLLDVYFGGGVP